MPAAPRPAPAPRVGVLGLGLIGGSLLRRLAGYDGAHGAGWDADPAILAQASAAGLGVAGGVDELVATCDVLVLAVPLPAVEPVLDEIAPRTGTGFAYAGPLLTDVTSVKAAVLALAAQRELPLVGGHPMAGTAESGFAASDAALLDRATWALCVEDGTDLPSWLAVARLVTGLGCAVVPITADAHDAAVARVSQLPHLLAAALAAGADDPLARALAAGSFRDGTRVAATRTELTAAMCAGNAVAVGAALDEALDRLGRVRALLRDGADLRPWFEQGRSVRSQLDAPRSHARRRLPTADLAPAYLRASLRELGARGGRITDVSVDGILTCAG